MYAFKTALNTSTLFPFKLDVIEQVRIAANAGYDGIELWMKDIEAYLENSGTVENLKKELNKHNVEFVNVIAFFEWTDKDAEVQERAFKQAKKEMELVASLGCKMIAAPPFGNVETVTLEEMAKSFERLVRMGREIGVEPILEFWGGAKKLSTLKEARHILDEIHINHAKMLVDPFHMYIGGSDLANIKELTGEKIGVFHVNDYPNTPAREELTDADRVFPGEGIFPNDEVAQMLNDIDYNGYLSLELFIEDYKELDALEVAKHGLQTLKRSFKIYT